MIAAEVAKRQRRGSLRLLGLVGAAALAALVYFKPWDTGTATTGADNSVLTLPAPGPTGSATGPPVDSSVDARVAANPPAPPGAGGDRSTSTARGANSGRQGTGRAATPPPVPPTRDAAAEAAALAATLAPTRGQAIEARRNAQAANATTAELTEGESAFTRAESHLRAGRGPDASRDYIAATNAWNNAAYAARQRAEAARQAAATPPTRTDTVGRTPPPPPADPRPLIEQVIEAYRAAIQAEDIAAIRRVFPSIPDDQRQGFARLFEFASQLRATYTVRDITISGASATASFNGEYVYRNSSTRRDETQRFQGTLTLARDGDTWRITGHAAR
jgi:ketosteroid isomerase-like protein